MMPSVHRLLLPLALLLLSACASRPATHYYTLAVPLTTNGQTIQLPDLSLGIGPVSLPPMLDQQGIVTQPDTTAVTVSSYHLWAAELPDLISHLVADQLTDSSKQTAIQPFPWSTRTRPDYTLRLDIERFSGPLNGVVQLNLKWTLYADQGQRQIAQKRYQAERQSPGGYPGYVNTLNDLLLQFADALALELKTQLAASTSS